MPEMRCGVFVRRGRAIVWSAVPHPRTGMVGKYLRKEKMVSVPNMFEPVFNGNETAK